MRIQDVTGAETLLDHLQIVCGNKTERHLFKVYISELPNAPRQVSTRSGDNLHAEVGGKVDP
jgi:hypothetical protein